MIAIDTNVLIYAISPEDERGRAAFAIELLDRLGQIRPILPLQVVGEYLAVARRSTEIVTADALKRIEIVMSIYHCVPSLADDFIDAANTSCQWNLQYFDALILIVARRAGAQLLLSEDMQDGLDVDGIRVVNPFVAANASLIDAVLG